MAKRRVRTHTFRGLRYVIQRDEKIDGYAEIPGRAPRVLYVDPTLTPRERLHVTIHEAMHAEDPDASEQVITRRALSLTNFLWRLGYRQED